MKSIVVRANGSKDVGMGHLSRAILIADYLRAKRMARPILLIEKDDAAKSFIKNKASDHKIHFFDKAKNRNDEGYLVQDFVNKTHSSALITDLLEHSLTDSFFEPLKKNKTPIASIIDDSNFFTLPVDLVLNGNPNQLGFDYSSFPTKYLLGPRFFIMDSRYRDDFFYEEGEGRVLVTLGGSDHNNLLFDLLEALASVERVKKLIIVCSRASGYIEKLESFLKCYKLPTELFVDAKGLVNIWPLCDIAITAGGNSLFERVAAGLPGMTLCQLVRQVEIAEKFSELEVNENIGFGPSLKKEIIRKKIHQFINDEDKIKRQKENCKSLSLGQGLELFCHEFYQLIGE